MDFSVVETKDPEVIKSVLLCEKVFNCISSDGAPGIEEYEPVTDGYTFIAGIQDVVFGKSVPFGLMIYKQKDSFQWECHFQVIPEYRKTHATEFAEKAINWLWSNTDAIKIVAEIPEMFPNVIKFGEKMGFQREGINRKSYMKNGQICDQVYMGLSRWDS